MSDIEQRIAGLSAAKRELLRQAALRARGNGGRISRQPHPERIPLTANQRRLWLLDQLSPGSIAYNSPCAMWLEGALERPALDGALADLVARHEGLRTVYRAEQGEPFQRILPQLELPLVELAAAAATPEARRAEALSLVRAQVALPFDLATGPVLRFALVQVEPALHLLALVFHHIAIDGWSISTLLNEFAAGYNARRRGIDPMLPEPALQIADVALWQEKAHDDAALAPQLDYWRERLAGAPATLDLPTDRQRPAVQRFRGALYTTAVPAPLYDRLVELARSRQVTLSMLFLAALQALIARYSGQDDVVVAMGVSGRPRVELEPVVGFFINTLALRAGFPDGQSFAELLARTRESVLGAMENADAPLDRVLETLKLPRSTSQTPFAQVLYFFQSFPEHRLELEGLAVTELHLGDVRAPTAQGDLSLFVNQHAARELMFEYSTDLFEPATIERLAGHLLVLLDAAATAPDTAVAALPLLTAGERDELSRWNAATARELPRERTLAALIEAQVARTPDAPALSFGARTLSLSELDRRANALAHRLAGMGVRGGALVGLYVERTPEMLIGLVAILKAGGAYVPLDPSYPADRLAYMLETAGAEVVVTQAALAATLPSGGQRVVLVDADAVLGPEAGHPPATRVAPDDPAYVIFTSGSTGKPKGVEIRQQAAVNLLRSVARAPGLGAGEVLCAISTLSFDIALFELVLPLTVGAHILLVDRDTARDGLRLKRLVDAHAIDVLQATPATWRMLLEVGWAGKSDMRIISTGEALPRELAERLLPRGRELWNLYGPTETTVYSTLCRVFPGEGPILVGKPVDNTQIHIVDRRMALQPVGVPGELLIGGDGLAAGYRGRPDLTAEKFIADPFSGHAGARLYRSGDLARWRPDGSIEVLGRIDHQIKLRGFRIELGEIEAVLAQHPAVTQAVVHCREDRPGDKRLVAYVTTQGEPTVAALRAHLKAALPDYMVPAAFVLLERFPLTPNGKVDRRALPAPGDEVDDGAALQAPATPEEIALHALWQQLLGQQRIDVRDDFFHLGGHSLLATQLLARIEQAFGIELPLRALFEAPTLAQLAARVAAECAAQLPDDLEALLGSLEHLSDEEAARLIATRAAPLGATP